MQHLKRYSTFERVVSHSMGNEQQRRKLKDSEMLDSLKTLASEEQEELISKLDSFTNPDTEHDFGSDVGLEARLCDEISRTILAQNFSSMRSEAEAKYYYLLWAVDYLKRGFMISPQALDLLCQYVDEIIDDELFENERELKKSFTALKKFLKDVRKETTEEYEIQVLDKVKVKSSN